MKPTAPRVRLALACCALVLLAPALRAATFTVTTTADYTAGSLRQACTDAAGAA